MKSRTFFLLIVLLLTTCKLLAQVTGAISVQAVNAKQEGRIKVLEKKS